MFKGDHQEVNFSGLAVPELVEINYLIDREDNFTTLASQNNMVLAIRAKAARTEDPEDPDWNILVKSLAISIGHIRYSDAVRSLDLSGYRLGNIGPVITAPVNESDIKETSGVQIATPEFKAANDGRLLSQTELVNAISPQNRANYSQGFGGLAVGLVFRPLEYLPE